MRWWARRRALREARALVLKEQAARAALEAFEEAAKEKGIVPNTYTSPVAVDKRHKELRTAYLEAVAAAAYAERLLEGE